MNDDEATKMTKEELYAPLESSAGYLYAFTSVDHRHKFYECFRPEEKLANLYKESMQAYIDKNEKLGTKLYSESIPLYKESFKDCPEYLAEMNQIINQQTELHQKHDWQKTEAANYWKNKQTVDRES